MLGLWLGLHARKLMGDPATEWVNQILGSTPTAWWRFDETTGTNVADETASGFDGTYLNGATLAQTGIITDDPSTSVVLNGTDESCQFNNGTYCDVTTEDFCVELWIDDNTQTSGNKTFFDKRQNAAGATGYLCGMINGVPTMYANKAPATASQRTATTSVADGGKHHLVFNFERGAGEIWVDGVEESTGVAIIADNITNTEKGRIGMRTYASSSFTWLSGKVDEVVFYKGKTLTASEVGNHYAAG